MVGYHIRFSVGFPRKSFKRTFLVFPQLFLSFLSTGKTTVAQSNTHKAIYNLSQTISSFNLQTPGDVQLNQSMPATFPLSSPACLHAILFFVQHACMQSSSSSMLACNILWTLPACPRQGAVACKYWHVQIYQLTVTTDNGMTSEIAQTFPGHFPEFLLMLPQLLTRGLSVCSLAKHRKHQGPRTSVYEIGVWGSPVRHRLTGALLCVLVLQSIVSTRAPRHQSTHWCVGKSGAPSMYRSTALLFTHFHTTHNNTLGNV